MAPLAGKPPFATDEPDSFYESPAPQRRARPPPPPNPNSRTSAYNVYDNYLGADSGGNSTNRQSGVGALGMGLMNLSDSDDDDSDDELSRKKPTPASKNAALAAATRPVPRSPPASLPETSSKQAAAIQPQPQQIQQQQRQQEQQHPTIAAPRPGYAAPIAALNLARPENATTRSPPQPIQVPSPLENPFEPPMAQVYNPHRAPIPLPPSPTNPPSAPHPLQAPITPITPVFARPGVNFSEPIPRVKPVMRGANEETLLPRRGEKGDDFWRRFSMVAKIENGKSGRGKESWWLKKTQSGSSRLSRWVWVVAFVIILCIVGVSILGWRASQNKPAHQAPTALGGSANERPVTTSSTAAKASGSSGAQSTVKHVSPTHTVARREAQTTAVAVPLGHARAARRRLFDAVVAH